jgi:hypothetical protein
LASRKITDKEVSTEKRAFVLPTLFVLWSRDERAMSGLQENVQRRLAPLIEIGALKWLGPFSSPDPVTGEALARSCETLLSLDLWQRLVERGYQPDLPRPGSPIPLQVIFIVDQITGEFDETILDKVKDAQVFLAKRANLTPILVWLGNKPQPAPSSLYIYWPRIRMEPVAVSGFVVNAQQVLAAAEHLLVALLGSNFIQILGSIFNKKDDIEWIVLGASALIVHPHMEEWVRETVLREILAPLVDPLPEAKADRIIETMRQQARKVRESFLEEALAAVKASGWEVEIENFGVRKCVLRKPELLKVLFGPYQGGVVAERANFREVRSRFREFWALLSALFKPFLPDQNTLSEELYRHYKELTEKLEQRLEERWRGLAARALEEYQDLAVSLGAFLDRGLMKPIPWKKRPAWWFTEPPLPTGLPAAIVALLALQKHLCEGDDLEDARRSVRERVRPAPLNDEAYLKAAGDADARIVREHLLRYAHFARTLASPWGVLLYLLPAWPLAAFLVQAFVDWEPAWAFLATGLALLLIGVVELAYWWLLKARQLLKAVQRDAHRALAHRAISLIARAVQDYRYWMLSRLREVESALADLYTAFLQRYVATEEPSRAWSEARSREINGCTYLLVYKKKAEKKEEVLWWKEEAVEGLRQYPAWKEEAGAILRRYLAWEGKSDPFESAPTAWIVAKVWPMPEQPLPSQAMLKELEATCAQIMKEYAQPDIWKAGVVAEMEVDSLKGGKRWNWLWQRAYPLGIVEAPGAEFTVMIAPEEFLLGSTGKGSPDWRSDWRIATPLLAQEEICIRGVAERKRGE